jgi:hypothetical protein
VLHVDFQDDRQTLGEDKELELVVFHPVPRDGPQAFCE